MDEIKSHKSGKAGIVTLNRPDALNAMSYDMCIGIEHALDTFEADDEIDIILIDATGDRAFCAGGDVAEMYATGTAGDFDYGRRFWTDEYRLNAKLATGPKPIISFLNGFTMGGGVGIGCHVPHRIVCANSVISMPECAIGLVPDVGGSLLLARAPGRTGEYLGVTTARMDAADAIWAGFADHFVDYAQWDDLKSRLAETGDPSVIQDFRQDPGVSKLSENQHQIDHLFSGETLRDILNSLSAEDSDFAKATLEKMQTPCPLAMTCAIELIHRNRASDDIVKALDQEYRFSYRSSEEGDFLEGIRALIIDKDKSPKWTHTLGKVTDVQMTLMLIPLGENALDLREK